MNKNVSHGLKSPGSIMPWLIWFLAVCFYAYEFLQRVSIGVYLTPMMADLKASAASIGILSSCYYYAYAIMQLPAGLLVDRYGPKRLTLIGIFIVILGSFLLATVHSVAGGASARFLIGMGSAFAFVCTMQFIIIWFPPGYFARLAGMTNFMGYLGATSAEIPLTILVKHAGWRHSVAITAGLGVLLFLLVLFFIKRHPLAVKKRQQKRSLKLPQIFHGLKVTCKNSVNWFNGLYCALMVGPTSAFAALWGIKFLTSTDHVSHQVAAAALSAVFIGVAIGSPIFGAISDVFNLRRPLLITAAAGSALATVLIIYLNVINLPVLFMLCFLFGFFQSGHVLCFANAKDGNHRIHSGTAIAFINMALVIGGALLQPSVGIILSWLHHGQTLHGLPYYSPDVFHSALIVLPLCQVIACSLALFAIKDPQKERLAM
jgi:MFS family permease